MIENPILRGFCPDPSIVRVDDNYYIATSTFEWFPGVNLFHSTNLKDWKQLPSPLSRKSQLDMIGNPNNAGIWAPCLSYSNGTFYLVFTDVKTQKRPFYNCHNYLVWTNDICGKWTDPVYLNSTGFDPSLFHDDDGKKYLINMRNEFKGILLQEYDEKQKKLVGPVHTIFTGTNAGFTEGPHLYKKNGWYYLFTAEGGTGWEHQETVARSKKITGPYEISPHILITSKNHDELFLQKAGHGQIVETENGDSYFVHLCSRPITDNEGKRCSITGRETAIQKVHWTDDGWPIAGNNGLPERTISGVIEKNRKTPTEPNVSCGSFTDSFDCETLAPVYHFLRTNPDSTISLKERKGFLRLYGKGSITSVHSVTLVARPQTETNCTVDTYVEFHPSCPEQAAGLCYMYNNENFNLFFVSAEDDGKTYLSLLRIYRAVYKQASSCAEGKIPIPSGNVYLRLVLNGKDGQFYYSTDGISFTKAFDPIDATLLSDEKACGFTGAHFALYCHDMTGKSAYADFDYLNVQNRP